MSNCQKHPDRPAVAYCRGCGKPLCQECQRFAQGTVFCDEHVPGPRTPDSPYTSTVYPPPSPGRGPSSGRADVSPGLAFLLGLIPGVGAVYNGQYAKGLVHIVILGMMFSIVNSSAAGGLEPLFAILIPGFWLYMAFEAFHTAKKRQYGEPVEEFSSIVSVPGAPGSPAARLPLGPIVLIGLGVVILLGNLDLIRFYHLVRYWPVLLIALGVWMLYSRLNGEHHGPQSGAGSNGVVTGVPHEQ